MILLIRPWKSMDWTLSIISKELYDFWNDSVFIHNRYLKLLWDYHHCVIDIYPLYSLWNS
jgi:hypothetical protein